MSAHGSAGDADMTLNVSDPPIRKKSDDCVDNVEKPKPDGRSYTWVVCFGIDDSTICEQSVNYDVNVVLTVLILGSEGMTGYLDNLHRKGSYLVFVNCVELPCLYSYQEVYSPPTMWQAALRKEMEKTKQLEEKYVNKLKFHNIAGRYVIRDGKPGEGVIKMARQCDADMIVVGTRGLGKLRRTILGSVSSYVTNHAHVPVIVCRPRGPHEHGNIGKAAHSDSGAKEDGTTPV